MKNSVTSSAQVIRLFTKNKIRFISYLVISPLSCICSILFALSLDPIIRAGMASDGSKLGPATLIALSLSVLDMLMALALYRTRLSLLQAGVDTLRCNLMDGVLSSAPGDFSQRDASGYLSLFSNNVSRIKDSYFSSICRIYENTWNFLLSMATLVFYSPWLGGFLLCVGILSICIPNLFEKSLQEKQKNQIQSAEAHLGLLRDIIYGYWIIKNHCVEKQFCQKYDKASKHLSQADFQSEYYPYKISWMSFSVTSLSFIGIISISAYLVVQGRLASSIILSLSQLIGGVLVPLESIPQYVSQAKGTQQIFKELISYFTDGPSPAIDARIDLPQGWKVLSLDHLNFCHINQKTPVFENAALQLEHGKKYVLIGQSGSGKSTLAKIFTGFYSSEFRLMVDGTEMEAAALSTHVSYMDQNVFLFSDTIYENISLYRNLDREKIQAKLEQMQFHGRFESNADVLDISVGEEGAQLSGGERQRIALLRELMCQKDILILDECTSSLDQTTARELEEIILSLDGITCIFITHQLDSLLLKKSDGIFSLEDGKIISVRQSSDAPAGPAAAAFQ